MTTRIQPPPPRTSSAPRPGSRAGGWPGERRWRRTRRLRRLFWWLGFGAAVRIFCRPLVVRGLDHLPDGRVVVLAANHASHADTAVLLHLLGPRLRGRLVAAAADDYFFATRLRRLAATTLVGALPFPRRGPEGLDRCRRALAGGDSVLLYPQGTRSGGPFRAGVGQLALEGALVVPVHLEGTGQVLPKGTRWPRRRPVSVTVGAPLTPRSDDAREVAAEVEAAVASLAADTRHPGAHDAAPLGRDTGRTVHDADGAHDPAPSGRDTGRTVHDQVGARDRAPAVPAPPAPPPARRVQRVSARLRRVADTRRGSVILYLWALAEALAWPLVPDSALMGMAFAAPRRLGRHWVAAVSGTLTGGLIGLTASRAGLHWPLPLVTRRMREAADGWLDAGAVGLWHQPLSGVPYKAFVEAAGRHGVGTLSWMGHTLAARGGRMLLAGLVAATAGWALRRFVPARHQADAHVWTVVAATVLLFTGLAAVVFAWSDAGADLEATRATIRELLRIG